MSKKKTQEQFIEEMKLVNPNIKIMGEYINNRTPIQYVCECGDVDFKAPDSLLRGRKCKKCGYLLAAKNHTLTHDEFIKKMENVNPNIKILGTYTNSKTKINYCCECGIEATANPDFLLRGGKCMQCGQKSSAEKGRLTHKEFVERMLKVNPNIHILGEYVNSDTKVKYICECGNENDAFPFVLLYGGLCKKCGIKKARKSMTISREEFVERMRKISPHIEILGEYTGTHKKIKYRCECGNIAYSTAHDLLGGHTCGCKSPNKYKCYSNEDFINKMHKINPQIKILSEYISSRIKIKYICQCGKESQALPSHLLSGGICPNCSIKKSHEEKKAERAKEFVEKMKIINPNIKILGEYETRQTKIKYQCDCGNISYSTPANLLNGHKCPLCKKNMGEKCIYGFLEENQIQFIYQHKFDDCRNKQPLVFDFYLPYDNICIEFDGGQHFRAVKYYGGEEKFKYRKHNDNIKNTYCQKNDIELIRIPYWDFKNIHNILGEKLGIKTKEVI